MNIFAADLQHLLVTWSWLFWILSQYVFFSTTASRFSPLFNKHFFTPFSSLENRNDFFGKGNFVLRLKTGITSARGSVGDDERWSSWWWKRTFQTTAYRDQITSYFWKKGRKILRVDKKAVSFSAQGIFWKLWLILKVLMMILYLVEKNTAMSLPM